ncbi:MAG: hypothetical protein CL663_06105 [Bacteroidetes bacterium]|nr:hypothetical protein [Bacteroidota bacterium]|tara:strand:+ start:109 stop:462 length:354 start_codon:yes stop_codon:yes gene_type:complete
MYKKLSILLLLAFMACQPVEDESAKYISKTDMIKILTEVHLLEASINHENLSAGIFNKYNSIHYYQLFDSLNITHEHFDSSLNFYKKDLPLFTEIYDSVFLNLNNLKVDIENQLNKE